MNAFSLELTGKMEILNQLSSSDYHVVANSGYKIFYPVIRIADEKIAF